MKINRKETIDFIDAQIHNLSQKIDYDGNDVTNDVIRRKILRLIHEVSILRLPQWYQRLIARIVVPIPA